MTFSPSPTGHALRTEMTRFMNDVVLPAEGRLRSTRPQDLSDHRPFLATIEKLKEEARARGLWNLFLPSESGVSQLDYSYIAELSGWSQSLAPEAINGQAPDSGNMELLHLFGTREQKERWLEPLLTGSMRSAFAMTEPAVASSDATNITTRIRVNGDELILDGHKWWTSGAADPRCSVMLVMGRSRDDGPVHHRYSIAIVPMDTAGVSVIRDLPVFGRHDLQGHCEVHFTDVRVPLDHLLGEQGAGFAMAQARLGPGRIHHCMRALGAGERALAATIDRARNRHAFGGPLIDRETIQAGIAESRLALGQARLLCQEAALVIDNHGNKAAASLVSQAKVAVPRAVCGVIDRAIQVHGGAGVSDDTPLAEMWGWHRAMRIFDGPDEVHLRTIARRELNSAPPLKLPRLEVTQ